MKTMLKLVTILAFANLLAAGGFVAWLASSGRVDAERLERVRDIFRPTIAEEKATLAEAASKGVELERLAADNDRLRDLPMSSSEQIVSSSRFTERATLAMRALEEQHRRMQEDLRSREGTVTQREEALTVRQLEWEKSIAAEKDRETKEQFRKAVRLLEAAPAKQAREWVLELVNTGRAEMAVGYLDAMNPAKSAALLKAFKNEGEAKVATDLLERLRMLGLESEASAERNNGAKPADIPVDSARPTRAASGGAVADERTPVSNGAVSLPGTPAGRTATGKPPSAGAQTNAPIDGKR